MREQGGGEDSEGRPAVPGPGVFRPSLDGAGVEKELFEFASFHHTLLATIPIPVFHKDAMGRYLGVNRAFEKFYGTTEAALVGKTVFDIAPKELAEQYDRMDRALFEKPGEQVYEAKVKDARGVLHDVVFHKATFRDADGKVAGIVGVLLDITERRRSERELELYYRAMQSIRQPLMITDPKGRIKTANQAFLDLYGYTLGEVAGQNPKILNPGRQVYLDFGYTNEQVSERFNSLWRDILDPALGTWEGVLINRKKDGTLVWVNLMVNAIRGEAGSEPHFIAMPIDISVNLQRENLSRVELYQTLASLAALRDNETGNHMRRVGIFAKILALARGMPQKFCEDMEIFAPLHDIGKVGVPDSILHAERPLTADERRTMETHTTLGHQIIRGKKEVAMAAELILAHHERWDGKGYPHGASGEAIPVSARITALVDVYDALRSDRPYKKGWTHAEACAFIFAQAGAHFDPQLVERFRGVSGRFATIYEGLKD